jgi:hypothetical protein
MISLRNWIRVVYSSRIASYSRPAKPDKVTDNCVTFSPSIVQADHLDDDIMAHGTGPFRRILISTGGDPRKFRRPHWYLPYEKYTYTSNIEFEGLYYDTRDKVKILGWWEWTHPYEKNTIYTTHHKEKKKRGTQDPNLHKSFFGCVTFSLKFSFGTSFNLI